MLERQRAWADLTIQKRDEQIRLLQERRRRRRIALLGPASETLSDLQLELLAEEEPSATREEVEAEARREPIAERAPRERPSQKQPHPGRQPLPETLPRVEETIACAGRQCARCGGAFCPCTMTEPGAVPQRETPCCWVRPWASSSMIRVSNSHSAAKQHLRNAVAQALGQVRQGQRQLHAPGFVVR
jgi:hypothetical protein